MSPSLAIEHLIHDHQKWAVEQALLLLNKKRISFYVKEILFTVSLLFSN
ncbi:mutT/nudix family protein [Bacillus mycoides]|nr:mutT/nudix family protein [Bacillus mycoides]